MERTDITLSCESSMIQSDAEMALPTLQLNVADYSDEVTALNLTEEEAEQFLSAMWNFMRVIVEMGFSLREFPVVSEDLAVLAGGKSEDCLEQNSSLFNEAAHLFHDGE